MFALPETITTISFFRFQPWNLFVYMLTMNLSTCCKSVYARCCTVLSFICIYIYTYYTICVYGGFLKWRYPTTMGFLNKNDHFGVFWGYHHIRKHPYRYLYLVFPQSCRSWLERNFLEVLWFTYGFWCFKCQRKQGVLQMKNTWTCGATTLADLAEYSGSSMIDNFFQTHWFATAFSQMANVFHRFIVSYNPSREIVGTTIFL